MLRLLRYFHSTLYSEPTENSYDRHVFNGHRVVETVVELQLTSGSAATVDDRGDATDSLVLAGLVVASTPFQIFLDPVSGETDEQEDDGRQERSEDERDGAVDKACVDR